MTNSELQTPPERPQRDVDRQRPMFSRLGLLIGSVGSAVASVLVLSGLGVNDAKGELTTAAAVTLILVLIFGQLIRSRFRVSIRTLLIATAVLAIGFAYIGREVDAYRREQAALEVILKSGGSVIFRRSGEVSGKWFYTSHGWPIPLWVKDSLLGENFFANIYELSFYGWERNADIVPALGELRNVEQLDLTRAFAMEAHDLAALPVVPGLQSLRIDATQFSAASAARIGLQAELQRLEIDGHWLDEDQAAALCKLTHVGEITIYAYQIPGNAYQALADLPSLKTLRMDATGYGYTDIEPPKPSFTPDMASSLSKSSSIERLDLQYLNLSAGALQELQTMPLLRQLNLNGSTFAPEELAEFRAARPDVEVVR